MLNIKDCWISESGYIHPLKNICHIGEVEEKERSPGLFTFCVCARIDGCVYEGVDVSTLIMPATLESATRQREELVAAMRGYCARQIAEGKA